MYCRLLFRARCDPMNHVCLKKSWPEKVHGIINFNQTHHNQITLKGIKDSAIMSSEMIIVNIRRRKIDKSDEEERKRVIDDVRLNCFEMKSFIDFVCLTGLSEKNWVKVRVRFIGIYTNKR